MDWVIFLPFLVQLFIAIANPKDEMYRLRSDLTAAHQHQAVLENDIRSLSDHLESLQESDTSSSLDTHLLKILSETTEGMTAKQLVKETHSARHKVNSRLYTMLKENAVVKTMIGTTPSWTLRRD